MTNSVLSCCCCNAALVSVNRHIDVTAFYLLLSFGLFQKNLKYFCKSIGGMQAWRKWQSATFASLNSARHHDHSATSEALQSLYFHSS